MSRPADAASASENGPLVGSAAGALPEASAVRRAFASLPNETSMRVFATAM
jgi:hypothetical protein